MEKARIVDVGFQFFRHNEYHDRKKKSEYSIDVLIDLNGYRKDWAIGWYDFSDKEWRFHQDDVSLLELDQMRWMYLPTMQSAAR